MINNVQQSNTFAESISTNVTEVTQRAAKHHKIKIRLKQRRTLTQGLLSINKPLLCHLLVKPCYSKLCIWGMTITKKCKILHSLV